jgi:predicted permease
MAVFRRIANLFSRARLNRDIDVELRAHVEMRAQDNAAHGMTPDEARRDALLRFGNPASTREQVAAADAALTLASVWTDIRFGLRQLRRAPGFTITSVVILALGIGAVTAVFSLINAALIKMLPVRNPEQLVEFKTIGLNSPVDDAFSYPTFKAFQRQTQALASALAFRRLHNIDVEIDSRSALAEGQLVSGNYFQLLGVRAILGRTIQPFDESVAGQNPVAVIGYDYWRTRFALDPEIVGKRVLLNNSPFTIIGVMGPEFYGLQPGDRIDLSVPLTTIALVNPGFAAAGSRADALTAPSRSWLHVVGRLQPGISREQAVSSLTPVFALSMREAAASLAGLPFDSPAVRQYFLHLRLELEPGSRGLASLRRQFSKPLWIVMAIVGLLLLITCANVANLLLARASTREKEIAVRAALGAGKRRLVRQLLTESILLALAGGLLGIGLANWGSGSLLALMARGRNPVRLSVHPDFTVLAFALGLSMLTALVFGMLPAWRSAQSNLQRGLAVNARVASGAGMRNRIGKLLVVIQVGMCMVLVIGAGLLTRTLANLRDFYPGFNRENVLLFNVNPSVIGYNDVVPLYERLLNRLREVPAVRLASLSVHEPLSVNASTSVVRVQGTAARPGEDLAPVNIEPLGPDYFAALEIPLLEGREFNWSDRDGTEKVAIVNQAMARHYFGDANPIGRMVSIPGYRGDASWLRIVGVVRDIKVHDLRESAQLMLYQPMFQAPEGGATFEVRTAMDPAYAQSAVLEAVKSIDSRLPVYSIKTLDNQLDDSLVQERLVATLSDLFGVLALVLTCVGLYGLMAYMVSRRTTEIGVRMALGAERGQIARMIIGETLLLVGCGLAIGIPAAALASRLLASQLFELRPGDPLTIAAACALMAAVTVLASWLPAHRAASVNPMQALRSE